MITGKKGSHVGVIISFVVFITFLIFIFVALRPLLKTDREKEASLEYVQPRLLEYLSNDLTTAGFYLNNNVSLQQSCLKFINISLGQSGLNESSLFVKNSLNNNLLFGWQSPSGDLTVQNTAQNRFFKIYFSSSISSQRSSLSGCQDINEGDYTAGLVKTEKKIFEKNIANAIASYKSDYDALKQKIGISGTDFGFDFIYENGTAIGTPENQNTANTKEASINYMSADLNSSYGKLIIKIW